MFTCDVYHGQLKLFWTGAVGHSLSPHVPSQDVLSAWLVPLESLVLIGFGFTVASFGADCVSSSASYCYMSSGTWRSVPWLAYSALQVSEFLPSLGVSHFSPRAPPALGGLLGFAAPRYHLGFQINYPLYLVSRSILLRTRGALGVVHSQLSAFPLFRLLFHSKQMYIYI